MEIAVTANNFGHDETLIMDYTCAVHVHESWVPLNEHHVWPKGMGGPNTAANKITLCMNGHGEVHAYIALLIKYDGKIPNKTRAHFGLKVRNLARRGWEQAGRPTTGSGGE
jgi:hypothetical protein